MSAVDLTEDVRQGHIGVVHRRVEQRSKLVWWVEKSGLLVRTRVACTDVDASLPSRHRFCLLCAWFS